MDTKASTVASLGEFGLIARIQKLLPPIMHPDVILGIGDDAAVLRIDDQRVWLITCDIQIEDQHFRRAHLTPYQLGRRAMAVNLSDIAAMGGRPLFALVSLAFPKNLPLVDFEGLYQGMRDQLGEFNVAVIGGNLSHSDARLIIDITLIGEARTGEFLTRGSARAGDRIFVTGELGASGAGLLLLEKYGLNAPEALKSLVEKHLQPQPRLVAGQLIAQSGWATAMIDLSDGVASDLSHICEQSRVGAELVASQFPLPPPMETVSQLIGQSGVDLALHAGEDYELLFTMKPATPAAWFTEFTRQTRLICTEIGRILPRPTDFQMILPSQQVTRLQPTGWDHFKI
ncbi:thiamine-phosphate kinase [candidate division KSB1 bacterium]|nr:thiamine-phosphate kinase [candidate division KSB1 bacterium]